MIPAALAASYTLWTTSIAAAMPLKKSSPLVKSALIQSGNQVVADIDSALAGAVGGLDGSDPTGFAGNFASGLIALSTAATDQLDLAALRGIAGRQLFNLSQL